MKNQPRKIDEMNRQESNFSTTSNHPKAYNTQAHTNTYTHTSSRPSQYRFVLDQQFIHVIECLMNLSLSSPFSSNKSRERYVFTYQYQSISITSQNHFDRVQNDGSHIYISMYIKWLFTRVLSTSSHRIVSHEWIVEISKFCANIKMIMWRWHL